LTVSPTVAPVIAPDVEAAVAALRDRGLRVSAARRLVLGALYATGDPLSAEQIADGLAGRLPKSDLASVYRNLETLEEVGLVRHVHLGHGPGRYLAAGAGSREYVVCERCDKVERIEDDALAELRSVVRERTGFTARFSHFPIVGLCPACATAAASGLDEARA